MEEPTSTSPQPGPPVRPNGSASWLRTARVLAVAIIGATLILIGIVLLVLPGPGLLVILAGLAVLASEFAWARWLLERARERVRRFKSNRPDGSAASGSTPGRRPPQRSEAVRSGERSGLHVRY